jgi:hypothetical protein
MLAAAAVVVVIVVVAAVAVVVVLVSNINDESKEQTATSSFLEVPSPEREDGPVAQTSGLLYSYTVWFQPGLMTQVAHNIITSFLFTPTIRFRVFCPPALCLRS